MTYLRNFEFNIFSAINLEQNLFSIINDYNNVVSVINFNISNYTKAIKENLKKDIADYKDLIINGVNSLKKIVKQYNDVFEGI